MRLKLISDNNIKPESLKVGNFYECKKALWGGEYFEVDGYEYPVPFENFESPINVLERFINDGNKVVLSIPQKGVTVDILMTEKHLIVYSHTKGNYWNISGNHYKYGNDINTGEYIPEFYSNDKPILKQRLLMADFKRLSQIIQANKSK